MWCEEAMHTQPTKRLRGATWQSKHGALWDKVGEEKKEEERWSASRNLLLVAGSRERDLIDYTWCCEKENGSAGLFVDVSQSASRRPWSRGLRSIMCSSSFYSFEKDRELISREHFLALGWPAAKLDHFPPALSEAQLKGLAGEATSLPCVTLVMLSVLTQLGIWATNQ